MKVSYSKNFVKQVRKLSPQQKERLLRRISLFMDNPLNPVLRNHPLRGKHKEYRSIDVTGDVRALYLQCEDEAVFDIVGTHSQLYG